MSNGYVTLEQVARHAGVSLATASRVLNGSSRQVGRELRERVTASADQLGYLANACAQTLARNTSFLMGLVVPDIADPYYAGIAAGVTRTADEAGLSVLVGSSRGASRHEVDFLARLRGYRARAVIVAGGVTAGAQGTPRPTAAELERFVRNGGGAAAVSRTGLPADTLVPDDRAGALRLAHYLLALGHRRFAVLTGPGDLPGADRRLEGFTSPLRQAGAGLGPDRTAGGDASREGGRRAARRLMEAGVLGGPGRGATCLFAVNDLMAAGALDALREAGLSVPRDVSVAGFESVPTPHGLVPDLTTVRLPLERMGRTATRLALSEEPGDSRRTIPVVGEVQHGLSAAPPPG